MKKETSTIMLAISISLLALAIGYFSFTIAQINRNVPSFIQELRNMRITAALSLDEIKRLHKETPIYLDRIDALILKAAQSGRKAGEGAVTGVVTGILKAPISLISSLSDSLKNDVKLSSTEQKAIADAMNTLLADARPETTQTFMLHSSQLSGSIELIPLTRGQNAEQRNVRIQAFRKEKSLFKRILTLAPGDRGEWELIEQKKADW